MSREEDVNGMEESYARISFPAGKVTRSGKLCCKGRKIKVTLAGEDILA